MVILISTIGIAQTNPTPPDQKFKKAETGGIPDQYIVVLNETRELKEDKEKGKKNSKTKTLAEDLSRKHSGKVIETYEYAIKGFLIQTTESAAKKLSADPSVDYVEQDQTIPLGTRVQLTNQDSDPNYHPWGLDRVDQTTLPLNNQYTYSSTGKNVNVYVIDSGINPNHVDFENRASLDADCSNGPCVSGGFDNYGHGTAVAGVIGGKIYGVAKEARIRSVKVYDCGNIDVFTNTNPFACSGSAGNLTSSNIQRGLNWVAAYHVKPAVVNFSLASTDSSVRQAIIGLSNLGVTVVASSGNVINNSSPSIAINDVASLSQPIVVGATDRFDNRASFSKYGPTLDVYAPGVDIPTTLTFKYAQTNTSTAIWSGTSFAAPHVTGLVAQYLQINKNATPLTIEKSIQERATLGVVINPGVNTPNRLIFSDFLDVVATNAASYAFPPLAAEAISTAFGPDLANTTQSATGSFNDMGSALDGIVLPTNIGGTYINVRDSLGVDRLAPLFFVSPTQVNYQIPQGTADGMAVFTVYSGTGSVAEGPLNIQQVGPGIFSATSDGRGVAAAYVTRVHNGVVTNEPISQYNSTTGNWDFVPINLGPAGDQVYLILFATGVRFRSNLSAVSTSFNTVNTGVLYAGPQGYFKGLDQINVLIPQSVSPGEVNVKLTVDGKISNIVKIYIQ